MLDRALDESGSLVPAAEKNLMPLSSNGLWEALMTSPPRAAAHASGTRPQGGQRTGR